MVKIEALIGFGQCLILGSSHRNLLIRSSSVVNQPFQRDNGPRGASGAPWRGCQWWLWLLWPSWCLERFQGRFRVCWDCSWLPVASGFRAVHCTFWTLNWHWLLNHAYPTLNLAPFRRSCFGCPLPKKYLNMKASESYELSYRNHKKTWKPKQS